MPFEIIITPPVVAYSLTPVVAVLRCSNTADPFIRASCKIFENTGTDDTPVWTQRIEIEEYFRPGTDRYYFQLQNYLNNLIHDFDTIDPYSSLPLNILRNARSFKLEFVEFTGESQTASAPLNPNPIYIIKGGTDNFIYTLSQNIIDDYFKPKKFFLTWFKSGRNVSINDDFLWLTWFNYTGSNVSDLRITGTITSVSATNIITNTPFSVDINTYSCLADRIIQIPASIDKLGLASLVPAGNKLLSYTVKLTNEGGDPFVNEFEFNIDQRFFNNKKQFLYLSSSGAWETLICNGKTIQRKADVSVSVAEKEFPIESDNDHAFIPPGSRNIVEYELSSRKNFKINTGQKTRHEINLFDDFRLSPVKYLIDGGKGLRQIYVDEKTIDFGPSLDPTPSITFTYKYSENARGFFPDVPAV